MIVNAKINKDQKWSIVHVTSRILAAMGQQDNPLSAYAAACGGELANLAGNEQLHIKDDVRASVVTTMNQVEAAQAPLTKSRSAGAERTHLPDLEFLQHADTLKEIQQAFETIRTYRHRFCQRDNVEQERTAGMSGFLFGAGLQELQAAITVTTEMTQRYLSTMRQHRNIDINTHYPEIGDLHKKLWAICTELWLLGDGVSDMRKKAMQKKDPRQSEKIFPAKDWGRLNQSINIVALNQLIHTLWISQMPISMQAAPNPLFEWSHLINDDLVSEAKTIVQQTEAAFKAQSIDKPTALAALEIRNKLLLLAAYYDRSMTPLEPAEMQEYADLRQWYHVEHRPQKGKQLIAA